jgi:hypothetical protein
LAVGEVDAPVDEEVPSVFDDADVLAGPDLSVLEVGLLDFCGLEVGLLGFFMLGVALPEVFLLEVALPEGGVDVDGLIGSEVVLPLGLDEVNDLIEVEEEDGLDGFDGLLGAPPLPSPLTEPPTASMDCQVPVLSVYLYAVPVE